MSVHWIQERESFPENRPDQPATLPPVKSIVYSVVYSTVYTIVCSTVYTKVENIV